MTKLRSKTFYTIFGLISSFIIVVILFLNIQNYQKEYKGIEDNLIKMSNLLDNSQKPNNQKNDNDLHNRIIMDYNFYTILLDKNNNIIDEISHNNNQIDEKVTKIADKIISNVKSNQIRINCLYISKTSYYLKLNKFLIIVDTSSIQHRLLSILLISMIILILSEVLVYYISKKIANWIIKPIEETFNKQKEFIANASHELKTPLAVMMASIDCLEVDKKNEKWINNLKTESTRMNNLITRLLDLSKSENSLEYETYNLNNLSKIIEKRMLTFEALAFENKVTFESNIKEDIMFKCNQSDIDELISIILDNAIRHSYKNSKIRVDLYKEKNNIVIDIINNGDEIPKDECEKIFERFYRSDKSRNRNSNRYGLGLAIAQNIVRNHGGTIKAYSLNNYTTFKIIF